MKKIFLIMSSALLVSCQSMGEAKKVLSNEKIKTTDEFLVKKRKPLILPPDYNKVPKPGTKTNNEVNQDEKLKRMIKSNKKTNIESTSSSTEKSILNKIRK